MNKTIIYGEVIETLNKKQCIYKVKVNSFSGDMFYKVISTKTLKVGYKVVIVGQLIHNISYLDLSEEIGLVRDIRELVLEADVVEIKSFESFNLEDTEEGIINNAFDNFVSSSNLKIHW